MAPTIVVVGASGHVGQAVVEALTQHKDQCNVKAVVRNPSSSKADALRKIKGVEVVKGDLADPAALDTLLRGATAVYINTPGAQNRQQLTINGLEAAKKAGVGHVSFISFASTGNSNDLFMKQIAPVEAKAKQLGISFTIVQATLFIDNILGSATSVKTQGKLFGPAEPNKKYTPISVQDVGMAIAQTLIDTKKHSGKTYMITGKSINYTEIAQLLSQAIGKPVEYVRVPYETAKKSFMELGMPEWQTDGVLELYRAVDAGKYPSETHEYKTLTGKEPTTFQQWFQSHAASFK